MTDIYDLLDIDRNLPEHVAARKIARHQMETAEIRHCANGCVNYYEPGATTPFSGFGRADCTEPECNS